MATELSMNGRKKIETLQKEFTEKFSYLTLIFLDEKRKSIDGSKTLSEVRRAKGDDLSIMGSLKVNTLEHRFHATFGLAVEVAYQKGGQIIHTKDDVDKTLNELNKWCQETGCEQFGLQIVKGSKIASSILTIQEQLYEGIKEHYPNAEVKKINKDNFLDIYVPSINPKRGNHLFFNTGKNEIKIGFYCRDEEYNNKIIAKNANLEAYSQGIRPKGNPLFNDVKSALISGKEFLNGILGNLSISNEVKQPVIKAVTKIAKDKDKPITEIDESPKEILTEIPVANNLEEDGNEDGILDEMGFDEDEESELGFTAK